MPKRLALTLSRLVGWLADRRVPRWLRPAVYGAFCRLSGADPGEAELPFDGYGSVGAFFVRRLRPGARPLAPDPAALLAPCDGRVQAIDVVRRGRLLQAKGRDYSVAELLAGAAGAEELEGGAAFTLYLSPRDYHRVHSPVEARLREVRWSEGDRRSVAPRVLERRDRVLAGNERAVIVLDAPAGPVYLVMVGALNVGRIRVVGVEPGAAQPAGPLQLARGAELARFELGSTVVLVLPPGRVAPAAGIAPGDELRLGQPLGRLLSP